MKVLWNHANPGLYKFLIINKIHFLVLLGLIISFYWCETKKSLPGAQKAENYLEDGFTNPPMPARPRAYWAWINGNVNLPQLTRELEEYKDKGLAGVDIFDIGAVDPNKVVPEGNKFLGKESVDAIVYAVKEAKRLGLELGLVASSSWNAGGDWVTPEYAAMLLYKSEVVVEGPSEFSGILPFPEVSEQTPKKADGLPAFYKNVATIAFPDASENPIRDKSSVVDLTAQMDNNGRLKWKVPSGKWKIMRLVCSNSGQKLVLPSPKSSGYNIDHFNPKATEMHFQYIIDKLHKELGDFSSTALKFMYLCSYELQGLVWTPEMLNEFQKRRGYDMTPFLPVLYGYIIQNKDISDRFMFDFNKTLSDLIIEGHYTKARSLLNQYGLKLCSEAGGPGQPLHNCPFEALRALGALDIPRGEFWNKHHYFDEKGEDILWLVKEISCASHIYGKTIVDGESFTSWQHWQEGPFDLKPLADKAMCEGLNLFTFHTGTHNPPEGGKPGWVYHAGTHMNPNRVWWPKIKPFINYLARSCYLLQQGKFVGDVCYYYGDKAPNFVKPKHIDPSLGYGFDYDIVNTEVILERMNTRNGKIVLPDGMSYELLVLPDKEDANLQVLEKIMKLVKDGATVVGPKPTRSNGLTDYPHLDEKVKMLADKLWGPCNGKETKENSYGKGKVIWGKDLKEILAERGIGPDFIYVGKNDSTDLDYIHRSTEREEIYFVSNKKMEWAEAECEFRVKNKVPELWIPETGQIMKDLVYETDNQTTKVFLQLPPAGSVFVVFREKSDKKHIVSIRKNDETIFPVERGPSNVISPVSLMDYQTNGSSLIIRQKGTYTLNTAKGKAIVFEINNIPSPIKLSGSWDVNFPAGWGAPVAAVFPELISWASHKEDGIKYFSGIATYRKEFDLPGDILNSDNLLYLDLGKVKMIADVFLNDNHLSILWQPPFKIDITKSVKPGNNKLVIEVANDWSNRIVGDQNLPKEKRFTSTNITSPTSSDLLWKDAPLLESGLIGPVQIITAKKITLNF
jgi:hypothetical protein